MSHLWEPEELFVTKDGCVYRETAQLKLSFLEARETVVDAKSILLSTNYNFERGKDKFSWRIPTLMSKWFGYVKRAAQTALFVDF